MRSPRIETYKNFPTLRAPGQNVSLTPEQTEEYIKCSLDPMYFLTHYYTITSLDQGEIIFDPYDYQVDFLNTILQNRFIAILAARQLGKSVLVGGYYLWDILFIANRLDGYYSRTADDAKKILGRIKLAYERVPLWLQKGVIEWQKGSIQLENKSKIEAGATTANSGRGGSYNNIVLDEFSFVPRNIQEDFMASAFPTINSGNTTKVIMITTPNGNDLFHKIYMDSQIGLNNFKTYKVIWSAHPNRDEQWKKETIDAIGYKKFRVEHECEFEGSAATVVSADVISKLRPNEPILTQYLSEDNPECIYNVYENPLPGAQYWLQIDPGEGIGGDFTTIQVLKVALGDVPHYTQVATWKANDYNSERAAEVIYNMATRYNNGFICIETNGLGASISDKLWDRYEYENLIFTRKNSKFDQYEILVGSHLPGSHKGIHTTNSVKLRGASKLENNLSKGIIELVDKNTIDELNHFVKVGSTYKAEVGYHDDLVMPLVLFSWLTENPNFVDIFDGTIEVVEEEETPKPIVAQFTKDNHGWDPIFWK